MGNKLRLYALLISTFLLLQTQIASAEGTAEGYVQSQQSELLTLLTQPKNASRNQKIAAVMDRVFDYEDLAQQSLGDDWATRTQGERDEFKGLLEQLVKQSYRKHLDKTGGWEVSYGASTKIDRGMRVPTIAKHKTDKRKEPVSIDYLLHEAKGQWRVFDVVIEGSSLVGNYRSQFRKVIRKKGFGELLARMKKRVAKGSD